jgi:hypothetical protein
VTVIVEPNPAVEGQPVTITVDGPGPYSWSVDGQTAWERLPIDPETRQGRITLPPSSGGSVLNVSDHNLPAPDGADVNINAPD